MNYMLQPLGDQAIRIEFLNEAPAIRSICSFLSDHLFDGVVDIVPGLSSITIFYDYPTTNYFLVKKQLLALLPKVSTAPTLTSSRTVILPTLYDGPDLSRMAHLHKTTIDSIIKTHASGTYEVTMLGFLPGFPYLNGLPATLETPRLTTPRGKVEAGAVGIGGDQTGVYPIASPGGWNLIGRTPIPIFSHEDPDPFLLQAGDRLRFSQIKEQEFIEWQEKIKRHQEWKKEVIFNDEND
ncbi:5-oxoprolinase subunit PxpB [Sutcliffiella halmapala]|uniref:5-oxoprolinase subunit PxpB n=1 Tax=Sutcliffiella halmapala TaxID=79882 RepID=UPI00099591C0|nr:5-oxoprolinase subunit PxpB [Sutcliffiella halmapala]